MNNYIYKLAYLSSGVRTFSQEELMELLRKARANNARLGITGILLYFDGNFLQVLEGDAAAVTDLYNKIAQDVRHRGVFQLFAETADTRDFPDWSMGFRRLDKTAGAAELEGFNRLMEQPSILPEELDRLSSQVRAFIETFRTTSRL
jgi:hypothetical protein